MNDKRTRELVFRNILENEIKPNIDKYEKIRKQEFLKYNIVGLSIFFTLMGIIGAVVYISYINTNDPQIHSALQLAVCMMLILTIIRISYIKRPQDCKHEFLIKLKDDCVTKILKAFGDVIWHKNMPVSQSVINNNVIEKSGIFSNIYERGIDDEFMGAYNGVEFSISETHISKYIDGQSTSRKLNFFEGIIILFNSNKKILNRTIVETKKGIGAYALYIIPAILVLLCSAERFDMHGFLIWTVIGLLVVAGIVGEIYLKERGNGFEGRIFLEDSKFNKKFNVYSSDEVEARYLVTPAFMERLNSLKTAFGTKNIKCSFFEDKFMVVISTKNDLFEVGDISEPINPSSFEALYKEFDSIYDMIDYFKLDEKTGL